MFGVRSAHNKVCMHQVLQSTQSIAELVDMYIKFILACDDINNALLITNGIRAEQCLLLRHFLHWECLAKV